MVIDYSQTVDRFTLLDAYPLSNINDLVTKLVQYSTYSTIDLHNVYHQIPIHEEEEIIQTLKRLDTFIIFENPF